MILRELTVSGVFDFTSYNTLNVQQSVTFQSSSSKWGDNSIITIANAATLDYKDNNQWETQGSLTKTGGTMSWDNGSTWTLSDNTSYSSDNPIATKTLTLNNHLLTLVSEGSDLTVTDNLTFDNSSEQIITGDADLTLQGGIILNRRDCFPQLKE